MQRSCEICFRAMDMCLSNRLNADRTCIIHATQPSYPQLSIDHRTKYRLLDHVKTKSTKSSNFSTRPPLIQCSLGTMDKETIGFALRHPAIRVLITRRRITVTIHDRTSIVGIQSLVRLPRLPQSSLRIPPSNPEASRRRLNAPAYQLRRTIPLLVGAESASELRVDNASAATRRASRSRATIVRRAGGARAEDRLRVTDGFLYSCQLSLRGIGCAALWDGEYLDVGGGLFGGQGDWACDRDGCEQHCGESGELHGDDCWLGRGKGVDGLIDGFSRPCSELYVGNDRWNREVDRSFYVGAFTVGVVTSLSMPSYRYIFA